MSFRLDLTVLNPPEISPRSRVGQVVIDFLYAYTGREWDSDAELYFYRARWYDPAVGRFIGEDSWGFTAGDFNLNRMVGNGPTNATDPTGHEIDYVTIVDERGTPTKYIHVYRKEGLIFKGPSTHVVTFSVRMVSGSGAGADYDRAVFQAKKLVAGANLQKVIKGMNAAIVAGDIIVHTAFPAASAVSDAVDFVEDPSIENGIAVAAGSNFLKRSKRIGGLSKKTKKACNAPRAVPKLPPFTGKKTSGVFRTASGDTPLISGVPGPAKSMPKGRSGGSILLPELTLRGMQRRRCTSKESKRLRCTSTIPQSAKAARSSSHVCCRPVAN